MMKRTKGFTLVELLVVVAIIALLVSILLPTLSRAKELAKRSVCAASLSALGKGAFVYANDHNGMFPVCTQLASTTAENLGYYASNENKNPFYSHTRAWYRLVKEDYTATGTFVCPSDGKVRPRDDNPKDLYDFPTNDDGPPISYAMQKSLYQTGESLPSWIWRATTSGQQPLAADMNGLMKWGSPGDFGGGWTVWAGSRDSNVAIAEGPGMNSPNHNRDGQNVLTVTSSVKWSDTALCGGDNDNIYTPHDGTTGLGISFGFGTNPYDETDPFLIP